MSQCPLSTASRSSFFFTATATTEIYTLSLHDALPISDRPGRGRDRGARLPGGDRRSCVSGLPVTPQGRRWPRLRRSAERRSEEHTSELQSHVNLVCRLLLEKKKKHIHRSLTSSHRFSA